MTVISLVSAKHSPGTTLTTLALAFAWTDNEPAVVVELDKDGGDLVAMCNLTNDGPGLLTLASAGRHSNSNPSIDEHCQLFGHRRLPIVVAPQLPAQVDSAIDLLDRRLISTLTQDGTSAFIDAGRFRNTTETASIVRSSDLILLTMRPNVMECQSAAARLSSLRELGPEIAVILIGDRPYSAPDIESALQIPVVGVIADDKRGVETFLSDPDSRFANSSPLVRSVRTITSHLYVQLSNKSEVTA